MAEPVEAQAEVYQALMVHFDRTSDYLKVEQICEMTGLDQAAVENALRVLYQAQRINGSLVAEFHHPILVTSVNYA